MQPIRVALIQVGWTGSRSSMLDLYRELVAEAALRCAALIGLPELSLFSELARKNNVMLIGSLFERTGSSFIVDPMGRVLAQAGRDTIEVITADLDPATLTHWRDLFPLLRQRMPAMYDVLTANPPTEGNTP